MEKKNWVKYKKIIKHMLFITVHIVSYIGIYNIKYKHTIKYFKTFRGY